MKYALEISKEMAFHIKKRATKDKRVILWCRGSSGAILSGLVSAHMKTKVVLVNHIKKDGENSHSSKFTINSFDKNDINIVIDDFIASGETFREIVKSIKECNLSVDGLCFTGQITMELIKETKPKFVICGKVC